MILMDKREEVIDNIRQSARAGALNAKVEVDDPQLSAEERHAVVQRHLCQLPTAEYRMKNHLARAVLDVATGMVNCHTRVEGLENLAGVSGGAVVTSNHFSPIDNTVVRFGLRKAGRRRMRVVGQETNLAMPGLFGFMMRYADVIPISADDRRYMRNDFERQLEGELAAGNCVLIYPEQEMWFNYRKPRPGKRGAYHYAARFNVPILSCFVEIIDRDDLAAPDFVEVSYVLHVLQPIFPDPDKSARQNSIDMCRIDYEQRCAAYEQAYGHPLDYRFSPDDIAGWVYAENADDDALAVEDAHDAAAACA